MDCPREIKNLYITSANRDVIKYPYGNSYTLYLSTPIKDITNVELLYAAIPNTMYNLTEGSNVIGFSSSVSPLDTSNIIMHTLPVGFYSATGLAQATVNATFLSSNVSVSYLSNEGKFLFTRNTDFTMNIVTQELASLLGFNFTSAPSSFNASNAMIDSNYSQNLIYQNKWYIKSQFVIEMIVNNSVFLDIQELRTIYNSCTPQGNPLDTTNNNTANRSFGLIPMDVCSGNIKHFKKSSDFNSEVDYPYPIMKLDRLTVSWTDKNGTLLNFNGAEDNSFILRFHTLRKNLCGN
jgi:hypothetical protein